MHAPQYTATKSHNGSDTIFFPQLKIMDRYSRGLNELLLSPRTVRIANLEIRGP